MDPGQEVDPSNRAADRLTGQAREEESQSMIDTKEMDRLAKRLGGVGKSIRFAGVVALTRTANHGRTAGIQSMEKEFTLRNAWSRKSVRTTPALKDDRNPHAEVYVMDEYLADQELGASRDLDSDRAVPLFGLFEETSAKETKVIARPLRAVSLAKGAKAIKAGRKPFVAKGKHGGRFLFVRKTDERFPLIPLYKLDDTQSYDIEERPWFFEPVQDAIDKHLASEYDRAFEQFVLRVKH